MTPLPLHAQPCPELGLDLVRDAVDIRRLPRWDPRYWGHAELEDEPRCAPRFRALGLSWAKVRADARAQWARTALEAERFADERERARQLLEHELSLKAQHAIARAGINLGQQYTISEVTLHFFANWVWLGGGKLEVDDGSRNWVTVFDSGFGTPLGVSKAVGDTQRITFAPHAARYVRLTGYYSAAGVQGLLYGFEIF